ncbi:MAG: dienelactone hydrolase family protein [Clostridia bacterium]|nr:dienelactone hydrolase family protein [Clostridia bacterium]
MIVSAISLWKKFNLTTPLCASEWDIDQRGGVRHSRVSFSGHTVQDGSVRIYGRFFRPKSEGAKPTVLLLPDVGAELDEDLMRYFVEKGYAVLQIDYSGKMSTDKEGVLRTVYPPSLAYGNVENARGLYDMKDLEADETTWFEWQYVALFAVEYLKSREDVGNIGVVGVRTGGALAWQTMLSPHLKCGVPINSVGWRSFAGLAKFGDNVAHNLSDDFHRYIAAVEAQSYAPYVKCPVLLLCALRDDSFDCDRAYDTYSRIGNVDGNALVYSADTGACIGPNALCDLDLFLEKNLKGREIYIPDTLNVALKETDKGLEVEVQCDEEGLLEEVGVYYAEADVNTKCAYRDWRRVYRVDGKSVKAHKAACLIKPFDGATAGFVYAYAKYINGFRVMSKITAKRFSRSNPAAVKGRMLFSGAEMDAFSISEYKDYSVANIFIEREAMPKISVGYGGIEGAFSVGGIKTYKISSPMYIPDENALLAFDAYFHQTDELKISVDVGDVSRESERYSCIVPVKSGGKWKRIILRAADFKGENCGAPLGNFSEGRALVFDCMQEETEFSVTNILWL